MLRTALALIAAMILVAPSGSAKSLEEQLREFQFGTVTFVIGWDNEEDRALLTVTGDDLIISDEGARDLRRCIDGSDACPVPELDMASDGSETDGTVTDVEVEAFVEFFRIGMQTTDEYKAFRSNVKGLVTVDGTFATSVSLSTLMLRGAEGETESGDPIELTVGITAVYGHSAPADSHRIEMKRAESNLTLAKKIVVAPGRNWHIVEDSIVPIELRASFSKGKVSGTQDSFEGSEPLEFELKYHKSGAPGWGALGALAALAGAILATFAMRRKA